MRNPVADSLPRLKRLLPRLKGRRIGVLGDLMLDRYLGGTASRLSPEAAVPVVDFVEQSECLGGAGNVASNIATLGARVEAFGVTGNDEPGRALQKCLRAANIADKGVLADSKRVTTVKTRIIAKHHHVVLCDNTRLYRGDAFRIGENAFVRDVRGAKAFLQSPPGLIIAGNSKRFHARAERSDV